MKTMTTKKTCNACNGSGKIGGETMKAEERGAKMNDEKECNRLANEVVRITDDPRFLEDKIAEALLSHGKSCYERGRKEQYASDAGLAKKICGNEIKYTEQLKEEITRLKERVAYLEATQQTATNLELEANLKEAEARLDEVRGLTPFENRLIQKQKEIQSLTSRLEEAEAKKISAWEEVAELNDRLANSWEKRTVEELRDLIHDMMMTDNASEDIATALVKFLEEKRT